MTGVCHTLTLFPTFTGVLLDSHVIYTFLDTTHYPWTNFLDVLHRTWHYIPWGENIPFKIHKEGAVWKYSHNGS
jgi:hypothetical protein